MRPYQCVEGRVTHNGHSQYQLSERSGGLLYKKTQLGSRTFICLFSSLPLFCVTGSAFPDSLVVFVSRELRGKTAPFYQGCLSFTVSPSMNLVLTRQPLLGLWLLTDGSGWGVEVTLPPPPSLQPYWGEGQLGNSGFLLSLHHPLFSCLALLPPGQPISCLRWSGA